VGDGSLRRQWLGGVHAFVAGHPITGTRHLTELSVTWTRHVTGLAVAYMRPGHQRAKGRIQLPVC